MLSLGTFRLTGAPHRILHGEALEIQVFLLKEMPTQFKIEETFPVIRLRANHTLPRRSGLKDGMMAKP